MTDPSGVVDRQAPLSAPARARADPAEDGPDNARSSAARRAMTTPDVPNEVELLILLVQLNARAPLYGAAPLTFEELQALAAIEWDDDEETTSLTDPR